MLADLCFADLLLFAAVGEAESTKFVVLGQVRPTTSQTLHRDDLVGRIIDEVERPLVGRAWRLGEIVEGELTIPGHGERARVQCIPVRLQRAHGRRRHPRVAPHGRPAPGRARTRLRRDVRPLRPHAR